MTMTHIKDVSKPGGPGEFVIVPEEFQDIDAFLQFENVGDSVTGEYLGYSTIAMENGPINQYSVYDAERGVLKFNGTLQMNILASIPPGTRIRVEYKGEVKSGTRKVRQFSIQVAKAKAREFVTSLVAMGGIKPMTQAQLTAAAHVDENPDADPFADNQEMNPPHPADAK